MSKTKAIHLAAKGIWKLKNDLRKILLKNEDQKKISGPEN